jgi:hypothetical protein
MGKRGRPRKAGPRERDGRPQRERAQSMAPTAELVASRVERLVLAGVNPSAPPRRLINTGLEESLDQMEFFRLGSSWLGVLYAAEVIDELQFRAGNHYHEIYKGMFSQGFPGSALDPDVPTIGGEAFQPFEPVGDEDMSVVWKTTEKILAALGRKVHTLVKNICVYDRFERFIDVSSRRPIEAWRADSENRTRFVAGLDALAMAYGYKPIEAA